MLKLATSLLIALTFTTVLAQSQPLYAQDIGKGYTCDGTTILKKGKVVKLKKAKDSIQAQINSLGSSKSDKKKKETLKTVKANLTACSKGTFSGGETGGGNGGGGSTDVAGLYEGPLALTVDNSGESSLCLDIPIFNVSFTVVVSGNNVEFGSFKGKVNSSGFTADSNNGGMIGRKESTYTVTSITDTSAVVSFKQVGTRIGRKVCDVEYSGTLTRTKQ